MLVRNISDVLARYLALSSAMLLLTFAALPTLAQSIDPQWESRINSIMGMKGEEMPHGVLRFDLPRTDIHLTINGIHVLPNLATDGYAAYKQEGKAGTLLVAELALKENEVNPVIKVLEHYRALGIDFTAHHNHLMMENPRTIFVHLTGVGNAATLAQVLESALAKTSEPRTNDDNSQDADDTIHGIDTDKVEQILGGTPTIVDGVLEVTLPCPGGNATNEGLAFPSEMGAETELHFQSLGNGKAIAAPEICALRDQTDVVEQVLRDSGMFTETAQHNHWTEENPRFFFIHATGTGDAVALARVLKQALEKAEGK
jgi:hypothetical protein